MTTKVSSRSPTANDHARWADAIRSFVEERVGAGAVIDVFLRNDVDHDGDDIVRVAIIFRDEPAPQAKKLVGLTRFLLAEMDGFDHFPITRLISRADAVKLKIEAA